VKPGFYISMGIAVTGLVVGFVLLYDIQQEKEVQNIWIQKIPTQCNDVWDEEYNEFYEINPEMRDAAKEESKEFVEGIIKNHYEKIFKKSNLDLEINSAKNLSNISLSSNFFVHSKIFNTQKINNFLFSYTRFQICYGTLCQLLI